MYTSAPDFVVEAREALTCLAPWFPFDDRISQHRYSAAFCDGGNFPLVSFMSKTAIRGNLSIFNADIAATHAQGLDYVLG